MCWCASYVTYVSYYVSYVTYITPMLTMSCVSSVSDMSFVSCMYQILTLRPRKIHFRCIYIKPRKPDVHICPICLTWLTRSMWLTCLVCLKWLTCLRCLMWLKWLTCYIYITCPMRMSQCDIMSIMSYVSNVTKVS